MTTTQAANVARSDQARLVLTYDNWATAQLLHGDAHAAWRIARRRLGDDHQTTQKWLATAAAFALTMADAKAQYQAARGIALEAIA